MTPPDSLGRLRGALLRLLPARRRPPPDSAASSPTARLGRWGEDQAARFLEAKGFRILGRRVRFGRDELDLVARCGEGRRAQLVFIEVKTRRSPDYGGPLAALDRRKRHALCRAAAHYMRRLPPPPPPFRFDAVEVLGTPDAPAAPTLRHLENAFPMEARYVTPWLAGRARPPLRHA